MLLVELDLYLGAVDVISITTNDHKRRTRTSKGALRGPLFVANGGEAVL